MGIRRFFSVAVEPGDMHTGVCIEQHSPHVLDTVSVLKPKPPPNTHTNTNCMRVRSSWFSGSGDRPHLHFGAWHTEHHHPGGELFGRAAMYSAKFGSLERKHAGIGERRATCVCAHSVESGFVHIFARALNPTQHTIDKCTRLDGKYINYLAVPSAITLLGRSDQSPGARGLR